MSSDRQNRPLEIPDAANPGGSFNSAVRSVPRWKLWAIYAIVGAGVVFIPMGLFFMNVLFKEPEEAAFAGLLKNPQAVEALGLPVKRGWFGSGTINSNSQTGCALLTIPVNGSIRSGTVFYAAIKSNGRWFVLHENLTVGDRRIVIVDYPPGINLSTLRRECGE